MSSTVAHGNVLETIFNLFDLPIRNSYIILSSLEVRKFRLAIFRTSYWRNYWHTVDMNGVCKGK